MLAAVAAGALMLSAHTIRSEALGPDSIADVAEQVIDAVVGISTSRRFEYTRSDGSFFMNPIVPPERVPEGAPHFPSPDGVKLSAAWLIEQAGFHKGFAHGNVGISTKHTLAIVNRGGGTAAEVLELVRMIQDAVQERFGVELQPEPVFVRS